MTKQEKFKKAVEKNDIETVKELLKNSEVNPAYDNNQAIGLASYQGFVEIVKLLLDDDRVDPSSYDNNYAIKQASYKGGSRRAHDKIYDMLYYDYRICHQQLVLDIIKDYKQFQPKELVKRLIDDKDLQIFHPDNESLHPDKKYIVLN